MTDPAARPPEGGTLAKPSGPATATEQLLLGFFLERNEAVRAQDDPEALLGVNYFERDLLDSLGIVEMIDFIEDSFGVTLDSQHMQDPRFCSMRGLAQIIDELTG